MNKYEGPVSISLIRTIAEDEQSANCDTSNTEFYMEQAEQMLRHEIATAGGMDEWRELNSHLPYLVRASLDSSNGEKSA